MYCYLSFFNFIRLYRAFVIGLGLLNSDLFPDIKYITIVLFILIIQFSFMSLIFDLAYTNKGENPNNFFLF